MKANDNLKKYLNIIELNFDVGKIISEKQLDSQIKSYYLTNHLAYLIFHNKDGFMHTGISESGIYNGEDLLGQLKIIQAYIKKKNAKQVLELGAGNGSNSIYLAKNNNAVNFIGIDLSKNLSVKIITNYKQEQGDFHNLGKFANESFDLIFVIEALCHSTRKDLVLHEIHKKLREKGVLIIFDGYVNKPLNQLTTDENLAKKLTEKSMAVNSFDFIADFENVIKKSGFTIIEKKDLSEQITPSLRRFEKRALAFYKYPLITKLIKSVLPRDFVKNSIAGLLMPTLIQRKIACYYKHVLQKD